MNKIWEFIKAIWRAVKGLVLPTAADWGADTYCKLGDLIADKCTDGKAEKVRPIVAEFLAANAQLADSAMDGKFTDAERAACKDAFKAVFTKLGDL